MTSLSILDPQVIRLLTGDFGSERYAIRLIKLLRSIRDRTPRTWGLLTNDLLYMIVDYVICSKEATNWRAPTLSERFREISQQTLWEAFTAGLYVHPWALRRLFTGKDKFTAPRLDDMPGCIVNTCQQGRGKIIVVLEYTGKSKQTLSLPDQRNHLVLAVVKKPCDQKLLQAAMDTANGSLCQSHILMLLGWGSYSTYSRVVEESTRGHYYRRPMTILSDQEPKTEPKLFIFVWPTDDETNVPYTLNIWSYATMEWGTIREEAMMIK